MVLVSISQGLATIPHLKVPAGSLYQKFFDAE
jgi:hypothetical protein